MRKNIIFIFFNKNQLLHILFVSLIVLMSSSCSLFECGQRCIDIKREEVKNKIKDIEHKKKYELFPQLDKYEYRHKKYLDNLKYIKQKSIKRYSSHEKFSRDCQEYRFETCLVLKRAAKSRNKISLVKKSISKINYLLYELEGILIELDDYKELKGLISNEELDEIEEFIVKTQDLTKDKSLPQVSQDIGKHEKEIFDEILKY